MCFRYLMVHHLKKNGQTYSLLPWSKNYQKVQGSRFQFKMEKNFPTQFTTEIAALQRNELLVPGIVLTVVFKMQILFLFRYGEQEATAVEKDSVTVSKRRGHTLPHRDSQVSIRVGQEAEGARGRHGREPLLWFHVQGRVSILRIGQFEQFQQALGYRGCPKLSGTWLWGEQDREILIDMESKSQVRKVGGSGLVGLQMKVRLLGTSGLPSLGIS